MTHKAFTTVIKPHINMCHLGGIDVYYLLVSNLQEIYKNCCFQNARYFHSTVFVPSFNLNFKNWAYMSLCSVSFGGSGCCCGWWTTEFLSGMTTDNIGLGCSGPSGSRLPENS